jgi:hypothetical protein
MSVQFLNAARKGVQAAWGINRSTDRPVASLLIFAGSSGGIFVLERRQTK